jgi:hypothetical protein
MRDPLGLDIELLDSLSGLAWVVDADLRIRDYGRRNWRAFAHANGAPEWGEDERVLGSHLFQAISGADVQAMYARMLADIFSERTNEIAFGFRCDAPERQRDMRLAITPVRRGGHVVAALFHSTLLAEEMRPPLNLYDFAHMKAALDAAERLPVVSMCSLCQCVRPAGGHWMTAEQYYRAGYPARVSLSHTLCAVCDHQHAGEAA